MAETTHKYAEVGDREKLDLAMVNILYAFLQCIEETGRDFIWQEEFEKYTTKVRQAIWPVLARLRARLGIVQPQLYNDKLLWVWCGEKPLREYLLEVTANAKKYVNNSRRPPKHDKKPELIYKELIKGTKKASSSGIPKQEAAEKQRTVRETKSSKGTSRKPSSKTNRNGKR